MQPSNNILIHNTTNVIHPTKKNNNNNTSISHYRSHGSTSAQACAACKYQRRKCASDCILAPYFPHDRQHQFLNAHRLFGVSNIVKIVRHLDPTARDHAMRTIIFQSDARAANPVGGCHRIIRDLEHRISLAESELDAVLRYLALCWASATPHHTDHHDVSTCMDGVGNENNNDSNNNGMNADSTTSSSLIHHHHHHQEYDYDHDLNINNEMMRSLSMEEFKQMKSILDQLSVDDDVHKRDQEDHCNVDSNGNINLTTTSNAIRGTCEEDDVPFSYSEDQHDLKAAATFFTLTNCDI